LGVDFENPAQLGDSPSALSCHDAFMLTNFSTQIADLVDSASPSVVQVRAGGRAASGIVYQPNLILTTGRVVGRDEHPEIRTADGRVLTADIAGWDPASRLALLKTADLEAPAIVPGPMPRVGNLVIAIGRSLSNSVTATIGLVSVIGGPLRTGHRRQLDQVIRISAPVHDGFAGGAVIGADGQLVGVATAAAIRGLTVVIPSGTAWDAARAMIERGATKRGYLGIAAQPVSVPTAQKSGRAGSEALLVVAVTDGSPAAAAGLLVGDLLLALDDVALTSPEELIDLLVGDRVGRAVTLTLQRGGVEVTVPVTPAGRS
jgi:S1-C subfamily serine protease